MKKKLLAFVLILMLALPLALAGCDSSGEGSGGTSSSPVPVIPGDSNSAADTGDAGTDNAGSNDTAPASYPIVDLSYKPAGVSSEYDYLYNQVVVGDEEITGRSYLAHPDSVLLDNGDIITVFSLGHGTGGTFMRISHDKGLTYETVSIPASFAETEETPTIYKLNFTDGTQKLVIIAGRPSWPAEGNLGEGWDAAISTSLDPDGGCNGLEWTDMENFYGPNASRSEYYRLAGADKFDAVVAMSSLTQMRDENGNYIDKWMGLYHDDRNFTVYKTYLTFNEDGLMEWSEPERLLGQKGEWRQVETDNDFCEVEVLRSPDGNELAALFRVNTKQSCSYVSFSEDEGATWSEPQTVAAELTGERHKAEYDPVSGKLIITMRSIVYPRNNPNLGWYSYGWVAWIGDYEDLKRGEDGHGDMLVKLAHTYGVDGEEIALSANADTGYAGLTVMADGTVVAIYYGTFSPASDEELGGKTYVMAKRFKVKDLAAVGGVTLR